jgi:hypothetical protein
MISASPRIGPFAVQHAQRNNLQLEPKYPFELKHVLEKETTLQ